MDGRILGSIVLLVNTMQNGVIYLQNRATQHPQGASVVDYVQMTMVNALFWAVVCVVFHFEVFLRGEASRIRGWLASVPGSGVLGWVVLTTSFASFLSGARFFLFGPGIVGPSAMITWIPQAFIVLIAGISLFLTKARADLEPRSLD